MNIFKRFYFKLYLIIKYGVHWKKPVYMLKLLRNLFLAKLFNLLRPFGINKFAARGIDFAVTYACNFRCPYCYASRLIPKENPCRMTIDDYKRVAKQAIKLGYIVFSFQGGEPALEKRMIDILQAFKPKYNHLTITTNGSLLTERMIKNWAEAGVDTIYFSIDSGIPEEHDQIRRQPGNFKKIMEDIEWVKKYGMKVAINTVVSRENLYTEGFKKILDYSHKNRIMLETIYARPLGKWTGYQKNMLNTKDIEYYYKIRKNYPFVVRDLDNNYGRWGCPAVKEALYITPYGDVCGCPYNHISLGNIHDELLKRIRQRGLRVKWYDHYHYECLTAIDKDFIEAYLPLADKKGLVYLEDLISNLKD